MSQGSGAERIANERLRQIREERYTLDHDREHVGGELLDAAALYLQAAQIVEEAPATQAAMRHHYEKNDVDPDKSEDVARMVANPARYYFGWNEQPGQWPWTHSDWNPSPSAIRNLEKAGALIAAEIDRLLAGEAEQG